MISFNSAAARDAARASAQDSSRASLKSEAKSRYDSITDHNIVIYLHI